MITVYVSIGNSDDKLTQSEWSVFHRTTDSLIRNHCWTVYGAWLSEPSSQWQNACWGFGIDKEQARELAEQLQHLAFRFRQDSIAWASVLRTRFLEPVEK